jgi:hypothetical protein
MVQSTSLLEDVRNALVPLLVSLVLVELVLGRLGEVEGQLDGCLVDQEKMEIGCLVVVVHLGKHSPVACHVDHSEQGE